MSAATTVGRSSSTRFIAPEGVGGLSWTDPSAWNARLRSAPCCGRRLLELGEGPPSLCGAVLGAKRPRWTADPQGRRGTALCSGDGERCAQRDSSDRFNRDKERGGGAPLQTRASAPLQTRASAPSNPWLHVQVWKTQKPRGLRGPRGFVVASAELFRGERSATRAR